MLINSDLEQNRNMPRLRKFGGQLASINTIYGSKQTINYLICRIVSRIFERGSKELNYALNQ